MHDGIALANVLFTLCNFVLALQFVSVESCHLTLFL
jgi:hypothetical protein